MRKPTPTTYAALTMYAGMGATLAGNAATANWSDPIAVVIAAFPALALFATFEMVVRARPVPSRRTRLQQALRIIPATAIMLGAAIVSVGHLITLAHAHGQHGLSGWICALLPDAMMILAAVVMRDSSTPAKSPARKRTPAKSPARKANPITAPAPKPSELVTGRRRRVAGDAVPVAAL